MTTTQTTDRNRLGGMSRADLEAQRPGCQDFLDCPSLRDGKREPYAPPSSDCVGTLRDKRNLSGD
jgi:hypothetical protein